MLTGAELALVLLQAGNFLPMSVLYPMAATVGAAGMFFGGAQTYGETIRLTHDTRDDVRLWGRFGLTVKGAGWFGIFGGILGFAVGAFAGRYALWQTLLFVLLLPCVKWLGVLLLNSPQNAKKGRKPKFYFSEKRFEVWGGILLLCVYMMLFATVLREWLMLLLTVFGMFFGGLGFFCGNLFQTALDKERENPKNLFALMRRTGVFSSWKGMECIFGAIGGLGMGLAWCVLYTPFVQKHIDAILSHSGAWSAFGDKTNNVFLFVWLLLFLLFMLRYALPADGRTKLSRLAHDKEDVWIWPVFCYIPLFLACTGNVLFSQVFSFTVLLYLLADKVVFAGTEHFETIPGAKGLHITLFVLPTAAFCVQIFTRVSFGMYATFAVYILSYLLVYAYTVVSPLIKRLPAGCPRRACLVGMGVCLRGCAAGDRVFLFSVFQQSGAALSGGGIDIEKIRR